MYVCRRRLVPYRETIPALEEDKCACMHGQKLRHLGACVGSLEFASPEKALTSVSFSADLGIPMLLSP